MEQQWRRAVSMQRKRAVMACFRMIPLYNISRSGLSSSVISIVPTTAIIIILIVVSSASCLVIDMQCCNLFYGLGLGVLRQFK